MTFATFETTPHKFVFPQLAFVALCISVFLCPISVISQTNTVHQDQLLIQRLLNEGDHLSQTLFAHKEALEMYIKALALAPDDYEVLRRISREYVYIGDHLPAQTDDEKYLQLDVYKKALDYANKAIAAKPDSSLGYTRRAIANGRIALFQIGWESIDLAKRIKSDLERAIEIDSTNDVAWYVLGRTHFKISEWPKILRWPFGLGWANRESALTNFEKAITLNPDFIMYRLVCARVYIALGRYSEARAHLARILSLPKIYEDDDQFRKEATQLIESIRDK
jgi:tetratricopeptide (TPR) repeat protein